VTLIVNPLSEPNTVHTPPTCGQFNGEILVQGIGGNAPYMFSIDSGTTYFVDSLFIGLSTDTFDVMVMDSTGCISPIKNDTLINPGAPVIDSIITVDPLCFGDQNGEIQIYASGGTVPLRYSIDSVNFGLSPVLTNLGEGTYTIVVRDDSLCYTWPQYITLTSNSELVMDTVIKNDLACYQDSSGQIEIFAYGGTPPLEYSIDNGTTYSFDSVFTNLSGGTYFAMVKDSVGCVTSPTQIIVDEPAPVIASVAVTNDTCFNACGGSAIATVLGGNGSFDYQWSVGNTIIGTNDTLVERLCADGSYNLLVTDSNGCNFDVPFAITEPTELVLSETITNISCYGKSDGEITLSAVGGVAPYWFSIDSGATFTSNPVFSGLSAGTYHAFVRDSNYACFDYVQITVLEPTEVTVSTNTVAETLCVTGCTTLVATASGGIGGPYNYLWNNGLDSNGTQLVCPTSKTTLYSVYAADSNGCTSQAAGITITLNDSLRVDAGVDQDICIGDTAYQLAQVVGGCGTGYQYLWSPLSGLSNGYIANPSAAPMASMQYVVRVIDDCESPAAYDTVWVNVHDQPTMDFFAEDTTKGCEPFDVTLVNGSNPVQFAEWTIGPDIKAIGLSVDITDLLEGEYDVTLRVITPNGCESSITKEDFLTVYPLPEPAFTMDPSETTIYNTIVQMTDISESDNEIIGWEWDFAGYGSSTQQHPLFQFPVDTGTYPVVLTVTTEYLCEEEATNYLRVGDEYNMYVPNSFTPNGDGQNDVFAPQGIGVDPNQYKLQIYDRWGSLIFESDNLNQPWDGSNQQTGKMVQNGVYVWVLVATDGTDDPKSHEYKGTVTVIR
jgi:gliding motility-associated-like protein